MGHYIVSYHNGTLTVTPAEIVIGSPVLMGQGLCITVGTSVGSTYVLEYKNALTDATWTVLQTVPGTGEVVAFSDDTTSSETRFYRIRVV